MKTMLIAALLLVFIYKYYLFLKDEWDYKKKERAYRQTHKQRKPSI